MIYYVFILMAVVCFTLQFIFTGVYARHVKQTAATSLTLLFLTGVFGAALFFAVSGCSIAISGVSVWLALAFAVIMIPYYVFSIKVLAIGSLAIYSMFMMLGGMLLPFVYGLFLGETPSWGKLVGCVLLTAFILLQGYSQKRAESLENKDKTDDNRDKNGKKSGLFFFLCLCIFVVNGLTGVISKMHEIQKNAVDEVSFTVFSCLFTALLSLVALGVTLAVKKDVSDVKGVIKAKPLGLVALLGAAMHTGNFLILKAAANVPASVQFPLISGGTIVLSALASAFIFKEKISKTEWLSVAGAFLSTIFFAF